MLPRGEFFRALSAAEVSESGDTLLLLVSLVSGGTAAISFTLDELTQRAVVVQDHDPGMNALLH